MPPITCIICCANSQATLEAACLSVRDWVDELIIVDSGSTDATPEISQRFAHRYIVEPWRGHAGQKTFATALASHDWVFFLDSDEEASPQLASELRALSDDQWEKYDLLMVPRENWVMNRRVTAWWPDRLTRIFHRGRCQWGDHVLHDTRKASDPSRVKNLSGWLIHKRISDAGFSDYFSGRRMDSRLMAIAYQMHKQGKRCHWWDLLLRPWGAFIKFYFLKRGFMDGTFGLMIAQKAAVSAQLKYAALWAVQNNQLGHFDPDTPVQ